MLASDLARAGVAHGYNVISLSRRELNVADSKGVQQALSVFKPHYVVHSAGVGVDYCELEPEEGYKIHSWASRILARSCERIGATFVYVSSCGLFGDELKFYSEYDPVVLKTKFAHSKSLGELEAKNNCQKAFIVRCGWLFGGTLSHQRNYVYQRFKEAKEKSVISSAGDKFGSPTYTYDLASKMLELMKADWYGTYHISNTGGCSRFDYTDCIVKNFGLSTRVQKVDSSVFPRRAVTPNSEMLVNINLSFLGLNLLEPWQEAIGRYIKQLKVEIGM